MLEHLLSNLPYKPYFFSFSSLFGFPSAVLRVINLLPRGAIGRSAQTKEHAFAPVSDLPARSGFISSPFPTGVLSSLGKVSGR